MPSVPTAREDELWAELKKLRKEVDQLARAPRATRTTQHKGVTAVLNTDADNTVVYSGSVLGAERPIDQQHQLRDEDGFTQWQSGEGLKGVGLPFTDYTWPRDGDSVPITSASFTPVARKLIYLPPSNVFLAQGAVATPAGTTGEIRMQDVYSGEATDPVAIGSFVGAFAQFQWLHPFRCGYSFAEGGDTIQIEWQARRTSGADEVFVYFPSYLIGVSSGFFPSANADGRPTLST